MNLEPKRNAGLGKFRAQGVDLLAEARQSARLMGGRQGVQRDLKHVSFKDKVARGSVDLP
jgi:hypothetical protein